MGIRTASAAVVLCLLGLPASAEIYRWVDDQGNVHFTSRLHEVPPDQRGVAERPLGSGQGSLQRFEGSSPPPAAASPAPATKRPGRRGARPEPEEERVNGLTEAQWRERAEGYRAAIARLEPQVEACKKDRFRWKSGAGRRARDEEVREAQACSRARSNLSMNQTWLENWVESGRRAGVPPGWFR
ncbi:MAG: DUF4124 domain-containing protein [Myxococcota bacterium]